MNTQRNRCSRLLAALLAVIMLLGAAPAAWAVGEPSITITSGEREIEVDGVVNIACAVAPADAAVSWRSSDPSVVAFSNESSTGVTVTGKKAGAAIISATASKDGTSVKSNEITITVTSKKVPTSVTISPASLTLNVGGRNTLTANVSPSAPTTWGSADSNIAQVDQNGTVVGVSGGSTTITAMANGVAAECKVTVVQPVEGVALNANTLTISKGSETTLSATVSPANATDKSVTWSSSNAAVAAVDTNGKVTAVGVGSATVTATTASGGKQASCVITVETGKAAVTGVTVSPTAQTVVAGDTFQLTATVLPADAANKNVVWSTSSSNIATVSSTGLVTAKAAGTVNVTAVSAEDNTKVATCVVTVVSKGITLSDSKLTLQTDRTGILTATTNPATVANTVTWSTSNPNVLLVSARAGASCTLMPLTAGSATVTATLNYNGYKYTASCVVTVTKGSASVVSYKVEEDELVDFNDSDFNTACRSLTGSRLSYVQFTTLPSVAQGVLYYDYVSSSVSNTAVTTNRRYSYDSPSPYLSRITFVPKAGYTGTVTVDYIGWDENGKDFMGQVEITVGLGRNGELTYTTAKNTPVAFSDTDFSDYSKRETGYTFDYIQFTTLPNASRGTLYYNYSSRSSEAVKRNNRYYRDSSPYLDEISFVPAEGYTGTVVIPFTGYNTRDKKFTGELTITVGRDSDEIRYTTRKNAAVRLSERDFSDYCADQTRSTLDYVQFTALPSASRGTLYYDYSASSQRNEAVSRNTRYYRGGSPYLDTVTFVPAEDFTGTVTVPFTGYSTTGGWFTGDMVITVGTADGDVSYTTERNTPVSLQERDFVNYCKDQTRDTFDYVQFTTLPSAAKGTLYYSYRASARDNEAVRRSTRYYRSDSPYLEDITFVPAEDFTGTVTVPFTGVSDNGEKFSGDMKITVGSGGDITYTATAGQDVGFDDVDFNNFCKEETGANLDFVQFKLPNASLGALYSGTKKASSSSTKYYRTSTSPYIDDVTFAPSKSITGDIRISFTGESVRGDVFSGTVVISYTAAPGVIKYASNGGAVTFKTKDFSDVCAARGGKAALSSVRFDGASTNSGRLYASYSNGTGVTVSTYTDYKVSGTPSLGNVTFVPKSGYSGKVNLTYTATDANNATYRGTVEITVTPTAANTNFTDMGNHSWAASSVDFLSRSGVVTGVDSTHYGPEKPITRGDFVLMLYRAFNMKSSGKSSFSDVPQNSYYAEAIAAAKALGIATGTNNKFNPTAPLTRQDAMVLIQRTMSATGRPLTAGDNSTLNSFKDRNRVSDYAVNAVSALVRSGLIKGDDGRLNPTASISRAEMAVLLHRVLTM